MPLSFLSGFIFGLLFTVILIVACLVVLLFKFHFTTSPSQVRSSGELMSKTIKTRLESETLNNSMLGLGVQEVSHLLPSYSLAGNEGVTLQSMLEDFTSRSLSEIDGPESTVWTNVLVQRILHFLFQIGDQLDASVDRDPLDPDNSQQRDSNDAPSHGDRWVRQVLNGFLSRASIHPLLGPIRISSLSVGTIAPLLHSVEVFSSDPDEPLVIEIAFTYTGDGHCEVAASLDVSLGSSPLASLPIQLALSNVFFSSTLRICIDTSISAPAVSMCFMADPTIRFDLASAFGYQVQLVNIPHLHSILYDVVTNALHTQLVAPQLVSAALDTELINQWVAKGCALARDINSHHSKTNAEPSDDSSLSKHPHHSHHSDKPSSLSHKADSTESLSLDSQSDDASFRRREVRK